MKSLLNRRTQLRPAALLPLYVTQRELDMITIALTDHWNAAITRAAGTPEPEQTRQRITELTNLLDHIDNRGGF